MSWQAKTLKIMPKVIEENPKSRFIFLTLTVRNCELNELRDTLKWMHNSWMKLLKRKEFAPVQGWVRSVEVTRGADDTAHPHYHVLVMVKPSYFAGSQYVSQKRWSEVWQDCLGVGYTPVVDVRSVRPGKREKEGKEAVLMSAAICEVLKYSVKSADSLGDDSKRRLSNQEWLSRLTSQLFKTRAVATGGILKRHLKELEQEPEDLIHLDDQDVNQVDDEAPRIAFAWHKDKKRYQMVDEAS
jgi:plasmid rolling circle replication initiator protein Rep